MAQSSLTITTHARGLVPVGAQVRAAVQASGIDTGTCHLFLQHTSASLLINEGADPEVCADLERFFGRLVKDGDPLFCHVDEGPDDMPAHVRAALTLTSLTIPVVDGRPALGTWQEIFVWEHRLRGHDRTILITVTGALR